MSGSRAVFPRGSYVRKDKGISKPKRRDNLLLRLISQLRREEEAAALKLNRGKSLTEKEVRRKRRRRPTNAQQDSMTANKLRNYRIKRLLLEAKIGKMRKGKAADAKALRRQLSRQLVAEKKAREAQEYREKTRLLVERRKLRLAKMLREIRRKNRRA